MGMPMRLFFDYLFTICLTCVTLVDSIVSVFIIKIYLTYNRSYIMTASFTCSVQLFGRNKSVNVMRMLLLTV